MAIRDPRSPGQRGHVALRLDFRDRNDDTAFWNDLGDVAILLSLILELVGDECPVIFDFGTVTVNDIDLAAIAKKIREAKP